MESYNQKAVVSGNMVEVYKYKNPVYYKKSKIKSRTQNNIEKDKKMIESIQRKSSIRAKRELTRIIYCNIEEGSKFLTLTYRDNITDLDAANNDFKKFIKRLSYKYDIRLKYTAVVEFQGRGAIHYHVILYNFNNIVSREEIEAIWSNGIVDIEEIQRAYEDIEKVKNYMLKDIMDNDIRLKGRRRYFNSRGIKRPEEIIDEEMVEEVLDQLSMDDFKGGRVTENNYNEIDIKRYVKPMN